MKKLLLLLIIASTGVFAQTSNYNLPYRTQTRMLQILQVKPNTSSDSVITRDANGWISSTPFPNWSRLDGKPSIFASDIANVLGLQSALDGKQSAGSYLTSEIDPTVPSYAKGLNGFSMIKSSTDPLYRPISYVPTNGEVITALGFTPYNATNPNGYISIVPAQSFNSLTGKPTTLLGYGITDAYPLTGNPSGYLTSFTELDPTVPSYSKSLNAFSVIKSSTDALYRPINYVPAWTDVTGKPTFASVATSGDYSDLSNKPTIPAGQVNSDWNAVSGLTQILNKPTIKRTESYVGTTNSSGEYTVTFGTAFASTPTVVASVNTSDTRANVIITSRSTTGFTVKAVTYNVVSVLGIEVIAGAPVAINGASVGVIVSQ